ncbi:ABC transporter ATP-binding protein [Streptomyces sp. MST-110588]|nr:ABC transporter ATP-binding protein [Streptomyces sp. MST-110588]
MRFTYPGSGGRPVLDGLDLRIPAGASVAVVGANGAGKTTLIKLLGRLYEPDSGRITADGTDIRSYDPAGWRRQLAPQLQDFVKYPLSLRDNIGLDAPRTPDGHNAVRQALTLAGGASLPRHLGGGWETVLSREYEDGGELSGGQWQKVAVARALYAARNGALLILDEPTAHLDARAEAEFFERFLGVTRGRTTLLISHRFSGVRKADLIYVLDHGRVVEAGPHDRLMAADGRYARMYRLQAARFLQDAEAEGERCAAAEPVPVRLPAEPAPAEPAPRSPHPRSPHRPKRPRTAEKTTTRKNGCPAPPAARPVARSPPSAPWWPAPSGSPGNWRSWDCSWSRPPPGSAPSRRCGCGR